MSRFYLPGLVVVLLIECLFGLFVWMLPTLGVFVLIGLVDFFIAMNSDPYSK